VADIDPVEAAVAAGRRFFFIAGAEGSGTTVLLRLLSAPASCASLGGNFVKLPRHPDAIALVRALDLATGHLWDRKAPFAYHADAGRHWHEAMAAILGSEAFGVTSRLFFKRSFPFGRERDRYVPDLWDILDLWPTAQLIVIYRDPRAASYSNLRRGFDTDLRRLAVVCSEQLTWIAAQVRAIGRDKVAVVSYSELCRDPLGVLLPLAERCALPVAEVRAAAEAEKVVTTTDERWARELPAEDAAWLNGFFDARRLRQWAILTDPA
jgi:hypothetical protein